MKLRKAYIDFAYSLFSDQEQSGQTNLSLLFATVSHVFWTPECLNLVPSTPCYHLISTPFARFSVDMFNSIAFTHSFSFTGRKAVYFGPRPYKYGSDTLHRAQDIPDCSRSPVNAVFQEAIRLFPSLGLNSIMIHLYPDGDAFMPLHADDEDCIDLNSIIVAVSLGEVRIFNVLKNSSRQKYSFTLDHSDIIIMSKLSQLDFKHELPKMKGAQYPRISLTFRKVV